MKQVCKKCGGTQFLTELEVDECVNCGSTEYELVAKEVVKKDSKKKK